MIPNLTSPSIRFADSPAVDSFGRLRVSVSNTLFDSQQEYGLDTLRLWDASANGTAHTASANGSAVSGGNAVGPRNVNTRMTPITVSSTNGHYAILQSRQYVRYVPGKSHLVFVTGIFASSSSDTVEIVRRTSTSGSAADSAIAQADWNIDRFNGLGPSGIVLDFSKTQILFVTAQWLGVGRVVVGFDVNGVLYPAHQFLNANALMAPYTQTFNLPLRWEARTGASSSSYSAGYFDSANGVFLRSTGSAGGTVYFVCCSVQSEGGELARGFPNTVSTGTSTVAVTTRRPVLSIRPKATYGGITNRSHIVEIEAFLRATTNDCLVELVVGGVLTNASFATAGANSSAEYDTAATAISGGHVLVTSMVTSGAGGGAAAVGGTVNTQTDIRSPLVLSQIDALTANQVNISIVCTSFNATSNVSSVFNWHELIV